MDQIERYLADAKALALDAFVTKHGDRFLLKTPEADLSYWDDAIDFETQTIPRDTIEATMELGGNLDSSEEFRSQWRVLVIKKGPGNPYPDRVSVGRAWRSDMVLRLSFVSKLHAHFLIAAPDGVLRLIDQRSANGTRVNGASIEPGQPVELAVGDRIGFGPKFELLYLDAAALTERLRRL